MSLAIGDLVPDFTAKTTTGEIRFHEWMAGQWTVVVFHSIEAAREAVQLSSIVDEFEKREVKVIGWVDPRSPVLVIGRYPVINESSEIAQLFGVARDPSLTTPSTVPTAPIKFVFIIGPDKKLRLTLRFPFLPSEQNDQGVLRVIDSLQLTEKHRADAWKPGEDVILGDPSSGVVILSSIDTATPRALPEELSGIFGKVQ